MKKLFSTKINSGALNVWLLVFRVASSVTMLTHGWPKFQSLMAGNTEFADPFNIGQPATLALTVIGEALCPLLIIFGLATRLAAIPTIITMFVAFFVIHSADPFGKKEMAFIYLLIFTGILILGPGKYSLDSLFGNNGKRR